MFDKEEYERWIKQADYTLKSAKRDKDAKDFSWACFKAHQAAGFAIKALLYGLGIMSYGHSLKKLFEYLSQKIEIPNEILRFAKILDRHYIPTRYPNAYYEGSPFEFYEEKDAEEAIKSAESIINFIRDVANDTIRRGN
jgi:HEPN domain-containing protein